MSVSIGYIAFDCKRYMENGTGEEKVMGAVVGPKKIVERINDTGDNKLIIYSECSNSHICTNPICGYSSTAKSSGRKYVRL